MVVQMVGGWWCRWLGGGGGYGWGVGGDALYRGPPHSEIKLLECVEHRHHVRFTPLRSVGDNKVCVCVVIAHQRLLTCDHAHLSVSCSEMNHL